MLQFGGKDSKRHFTVVMGNKEHGLYVSSTPSSAAKKAVTKLCTANKTKKVDFHIREITQGSKKKTYGPYEGYIEKLKEPIELKGRVIKYKPFAKLIRGKSVKKGGMFRPSARTANSEMVCIHDRNFEGNIQTTLLRINPDENIWAEYTDGSPIILEHGEKVIIINRNIRKNPKGDEYFYVIKENSRADGFGGLVKAKYIKCSNPSVKSSNKLLSEFNLNNNKSRPTSLPGLRGQTAYTQRQPTSLPGLRGQTAYTQIQPTFSNSMPHGMSPHGMSPHGMSPHGMAAHRYNLRNNTSASSALSPNFNQLNIFDRRIRRLIDSRMTSGETRLSDLLELCTNIYFNMFKIKIPIEKLRELQEDIMLNPISSKNGKNIIFRKIF
jgi:hypothetical protein